MSSSPPVPRLKNMVEITLRDNPKVTLQGRAPVEVRNSDIALTIVIWQTWYNVGANPDSIVHLYRLFDLPREDNIKRLRAIFQNTEHKYLPTDPNVLIKRGIEQQYWEEALGYKLTKDEWVRHHETAKASTPPPMSEMDMLVAGESSMQPIVVKPREPIPVSYTTKLIAKYLPRSYGSSILQMGEEYEIELEKLATGQPIKMLKPIEAVYPNLLSFAKTWRVVK
jgi:hypothetical protein